MAASATPRNKSVQTASDKTATRSRELAPEDLVLRLSLAERLQESLDLTELLSLLLEQINTSIRIDGLHYHHELLDLDVQIERQASHSCGYRLLTRQDHLGELIFKRSRKFSERELALIESILSLLLNPLRNALAFRSVVDAARRDPLSGACTHQMLQRSLPREVDMAKRHNQPLSLMVLTIDGLEEVNHNEGRGHGDELLRQLVTVIDRESRETDRIFRLSDEQLLVLMNQTSLDGARQLAQRIQRTLASCDTMTFSTCIGLATVAGTDSWESLLKRASRNLNKARQRGTGRIAAR